MGCILLSLSQLFTRILLYCYLVLSIITLDINIIINISCLLYLLLHSSITIILLYLLLVLLWCVGNVSFHTPRSSWFGMPLMASLDEDSWQSLLQSYFCVFHENSWVLQTSSRAYFRVIIGKNQHGKVYGRTERRTCRC